VAFEEGHGIFFILDHKKKTLLTITWLLTLKASRSFRKFQQNFNFWLRVSRFDQNVVPGKIFTQCYAES